MSKTEEKKILAPPSSLSKSTILSYGVGHMFNDLTASMWFSYLILFFNYVLGFDSSTSGLALLIGQLADGIATPIIGILSDKGAGHWMCKYGHRKSWHLLGTFFGVMGFPFIFSKCFIDFGQTDVFSKMIYYSVFIIIYQFGWASVQISHLSLAPDLTPNQNERTSLLTVRYAFTVISNIIVHLFTWLMFTRMTESHVIDKSDINKFQRTALFAVSVGCVASLIFHLGVKELPHRVQKSNSIDYDPKKSGTVVNKRNIMCSPGMYHIMIIYAMSQLYVNQSQVFIPLYLEEYLHLESKRLPILPLIMYISSSVMSFLTKAINNYYGRKTAYVVGSTIAFLVCIPVYFGSGKFYCEYIIYAVTTMFGCASSVLSITGVGITADLIGQHTTQGAFVYGLMSFADKISNGSFVMIIQAMKSYYGPEYYRNMLIIMCGGSAVIGTIFVILLPRNLKLIKREDTKKGGNPKIVYCYENDVSETLP